MSRICVFPGSFDPFTVGHLDVVRRALAVTDRLVVAVGVNRAKTPFLDADVRVEAIRACLAEDLREVGAVERVGVERMDVPLVEFCARLGAGLVVKGVRDGADFASESVQASVNRDLGGVETLLLPTRGEFAHVSSSLVRELWSWGMDVSRYVPSAIRAVMPDNGGSTVPVDQGGPRR